MEIEKTTLLRKWYVRIRIAQAGHYKDAGRYRRKNTYLGMSVVALSTVVGTSIFASLSEKVSGAQESDFFQILLGLISVSAATMAALQTFLNYSEESTKHLTAATRLSSLKKEIEKNLILLSEEEAELVKFIEDVKTEWDSITTESPLISNKVFEGMFKKYGGEDRFLETDRVGSKIELNNAN